MEEKGFANLSIMSHLGHQIACRYRGEILWARCFVLYFDVILVMILEAHIALRLDIGRNLDAFECSRKSVVVFQQPLHSFDLVFEALLLVCSGANPDVALDPNDSILMQQSMALSNNSHAVIP